MSLPLLRSNAVRWSDDASVAAAVGTTGGFLWVAFRFLVGAVIADSVSDIRNIKTELEDLKKAHEGTQTSLNELVQALIERRN